MDKVKKKTSLHEPVLVGAVIEALKVKEFAHSKIKGRFIDATLGTSGHSLKILQEGGEVLGIEADPDSLKIAKEKLEESGLFSFKLVHGRFGDIETIANEYGFVDIDGILYDLGISSYQMFAKSRGFSFQDRSAPLDMRIDPENQKVTAQDLVAVLDKSQLTDLFEEILPTNISRKIAERIVRLRQTAKIETVGSFLDLVSPVSMPRRNLNPATLAFLALRIAVNSEMSELESSLPRAFGLLKKGGRMAVISFHSKEDLVVKSFFKKLASNNEAKILTKNPIVPTAEEIRRNLRSRSAKMRVSEKV